jgi:hypothetical protein
VIVLVMRCFANGTDFPLCLTQSREQHMLYADSSPVSGGSVLIKMTRNNSV